VILKPGEESPATALALARCLDDAGLPKGVLQIVFGAPDQISATLIASPVIRKVAFTGSVPVGRLLSGRAAAGVKPITLELGGHGPVLVLPMQILKRLPLAGRRTGSGAPGKSVSLQPAF
jgi:succinate-semialdehyde dehydrogenase/glutarate-semialdehyde dehydrogenase